MKSKEPFEPIADEALRLADAATPGPWEAKEHYGPSDPEWWADHGDAPSMWMPEGLAWIDQDEHGRYMTQADAEFVARARTLLPEVASRVKELEEQKWNHEAAAQFDRAEALQEERDKQRDRIRKLQEAAGCAQYALMTGAEQDRGEALGLLALALPKQSEEEARG